MTSNKGEAAQRYLSGWAGALAVVVLAGCSSAPSEPAAPTPPAGDTARQICDASAVQYAIGAPFDEANIATLEAQSGARQVRVLRPGTAATMDYRDDRLNVHLESNDAIEALRCG